MENQQEKQVKENIWADPDLAELLFISEENRNNEISEPHEAEAEDEIVIETPDVQDPEMAYQLYHGSLQPLLRKYLNGTTSQAKSSIRVQVNLLLKDGHKKGRDGKQAYYYRLQQAIDIINKWIKLCAADKIPLTETRTFRLYIMFKDAVDSLEETA